MYRETGKQASVSDPRKKVFVTGVGATTALAGDVAGTWDALLRGGSGIRLVEGDIWEGFPPVIAGTAHVDPGPGLEPLQRRRLGRSAQFAVTAADEAWKDAELDSVSIRPERLAVAISAAIGDTSVIIDSWETLKLKGWNRVPPLTVPMAMGNSPAAAVSLRVNARAGVHATVNACSSGTQALATAATMIRQGLADVVVAGGAEAPLHPLIISSFAAMRALSQRINDPRSASRPYDMDRDGMVMSEGSGILILESEEHARNRGARVYAELMGIGISSDAFHLVQPEPNGEGDAEAIRASLQDAGVTPPDVAHFNANATATVPGDAAEARAVHTVFGEHTKQLLVTANKSMLGHSLGAAGAIESIATVLSVHHRVVPPTRNFIRHEDGLSVQVVHNGPAKMTDDRIVAVKNSAGFGGHNVALTFGSI